MKRVKKFIVLLLAVTMLVGINTSYVNAEENEGCEHTAICAGKTECINCSYGVAHPHYINGNLVSCQIHYYTYRTPNYCFYCDEFLYYDYTYKEEHQYKHY